MFEEKAAPNGSDSLLLTSMSFPRNYQFREWYPYRLGNTTLNINYPVLSELPSQQCCTFGNDYDPDWQKLSGSVTVILPDVVLQHILTYLHPISKVKCSAVCQRWNALVSSPSTWKGLGIRVIISEDPVKFNAAEKFMKEVAMLVKKLCFYSNAELSDDYLNRLLPKKLSNLTVLDIGKLKGITKHFIRKINSAVPNLEVLNMEDIVPVSTDCLYELFTDDAFPRLKELVLAFVQLTDSVMARLVNWNRPLQVLNIDGSFPLHDGWHQQVNVNNAQFAKTLKRFYTNGFTREITVFNNLMHFENLMLLSLSYCPEAVDNEFLTIKNLRQLEHLHLTGQCSWMRTDSLLHLFTVPHDDPYGFPYRLKFLCLSHFYDLNDGVIELITRSCPKLQALNVSRSDSLTDAGMQMIVGKLRHLRHLDVSHNRSFHKGIVTSIVENLPHLRFLVAHNCINVDINDLKELTQQRSDMYISVDRSYVLGCFLRKEDERNEALIVRILDRLREIDGLCCVTDIMKPFL